MRAELRFGVPWVIHRVDPALPRLGRRKNGIPELFGPMDSNRMCGPGAALESELCSCSISHKCTGEGWKPGRGESHPHISDLAGPCVV